MRVGGGGQDLGAPVARAETPAPTPASALGSGAPKDVSRAALGSGAPAAVSAGAAPGAMSGAGALRDPLGVTRAAAEARVARKVTLSSAGEAAARLPRSRGPEGVERLLTPRDLSRLEQLAGELPPATRASIEATLAAQHGPSASVARGVLLRAALARSAQLLSTADSAAALAELSAFAAKLGGLSPDEIRRRATSLDLDSTLSTSAIDPLKLSLRRGLVKKLHATDRLTDNDGLFQKVTASCGPTVVQMMIAEADPIAAFSMHDQGLGSEASDSPVAIFQSKLLEELGGIAIGRREAQSRARLRNAIGRLKGGGGVAAEDLAALRARIDSSAPRCEATDRALAALRARFDDLPTDAEIDQLAGSVPKVDEGWGIEELKKALEEHVTPRTGVRYEATSPEGGFARGQAWRHIDEVARAVRRGVDVPFGISEPAHWMLISGVKGRKPGRRLLVSDPEGGRTAWVHERDLIKGTFTREPFELSVGKQRGYVDVFLLPVR